MFLCFACGHSATSTTKDSMRIAKQIVMNNSKTEVPFRKVSMKLGPIPAYKDSSSMAGLNSRSGEGMEKTNMKKSEPKTSRNCSKNAMSLANLSMGRSVKEGKGGMAVGMNHSIMPSSSMMTEKDRVMSAPEALMNCSTDDIHSTISNMGVEDMSNDNNHTMKMDNASMRGTPRANQRY